MWDPVWESVFRSQAWGKYPGEDLIRFVARNFYQAPDRAMVRILEIGCGPGANLWYLAREGFGLAGIDGSAAAIEQAGARLDQEVAGWRARGSLHVGDMSKLPFDDGVFDAVIDSQAVYANPKDAARRMYREAARVTKPGGKLFARTFAKGSWGDGTGTPAGENAWLCGEGPLQGKGFSRFTDRAEIPDLLDGWHLISAEKITRSAENLSRSVEEWILWAEKAQ